jgi:hypothetical protein
VGQGCELGASAHGTVPPLDTGSNRLSPPRSSFFIPKLGLRLVYVLGEQRQGYAICYGVTDVEHF